MPVKPIANRLIVSKVPRSMTKAKKPEVTLQKSIFALNREKLEKFILKNGLNKAKLEKAGVPLELLLARKLNIPQLMKLGYTSKEITNALLNLRKLKIPKVPSHELL